MHIEHFLLTAITLCALHLCPVLASAQELDPFKEENFVRHFFEESTTSSSVNIDINLPESERAESRDPRKLFYNETEIFQAFGDPYIRKPVLARSEAPLPMQGMMNCIAIGNKKCAKAYGRQMFDYMRDLGTAGEEISKIFDELIMEETLLAAKRMNPGAKSPETNRHGKDGTGLP